MSTQDIIDLALPVDSPLHWLFEWDDERAENEFRKLKEAE